MEVVNNFTATVYKREKRKIRKETLGSLHEETNTINRFKPTPNHDDEDIG